MTVTPFKGRSLTLGTRVKVYRNLHKAQWSIMADEGLMKGLVVAHADDLVIYEASFEVNYPGRNRVVESGRKNVHAFVKGFVSFELPTCYTKRRVRYNPFEGKDFMVDSYKGWQIVRSAWYAHLDSDGKAWCVAPTPLDLGDPKYGR
jgi:hypothetical protein